LTHCRELDGSVTQKKIWLALARTEIAFFSWSNAFRTGFLGAFPWWKSAIFGVQWHIKVLRAG